MTIYFNELEDDQIAALANIKPGAIVLFSATGKNRPLRPQDRMIMLGQAIFKKEYQPGHRRANPGITHVAICIEEAKDGRPPKIVEININGARSHELSDSFWYKNIGNQSIFKFRPLHVFQPNNPVFRDNLVAVANSYREYNRHKPFEWTLSKAMKSLFKLKKTQAKGYDAEQEKEFVPKTQCTDFAVRCMKKAAQRSKPQGLEAEDAIRPYYPDIPTNVSPSGLLSYFLDKVEGDHALYAHDVHLDIDPYEGLKRVIDLQIDRLNNKKIGKSGAHEKAEALKSARDQVIASIDMEQGDADALTKARKLLKDMKSTLEQKRHFNPFKKATALANANDYLKDAETYTQRLR